MSLPAESIHNFHQLLHTWYGKYGRHNLPWRNTRDPYAIYISEIMLQQTQVKTVLERYYFQFLERFPTMEKLAKSPSEQVLQAWQGLGYYNRALNLHNAAKSCRTTLPDNVEALMSLPGIGRNTAHAVAAFAYRRPVAIMEANVRRVLSRIFTLPSATDQELWDKAELLLNKREPFDYNQAMMDIGAMVCTKRNPRCGECPAQAICKGQKSPDCYPAAKQKKSIPVRAKNIIVACNKNGEYYATPRTSRFLGGLYHFLEIPQEEKSVTLCKKAYMLDTTARNLGSIRQQYSHFTLEADVWLLDTTATSGAYWHSLSKLKKLPCSMAETKILGLIEAKKTAKQILYKQK
jgi:A/G-specific adenine glycosylase